jgi:hypothetical protein
MSAVNAAECGSIVANSKKFSHKAPTRPGVSLKEIQSGSVDVDLGVNLRRDALQNGRLQVGYRSSPFLVICGMPDLFDMPGVTDRLIAVFALEHSVEIVEAIA